MSTSKNRQKARPGPGFTERQARAKALKQRKAAPKARDPGDNLIAAQGILGMLGMHAGIATEFEKPLPELKRIENGIKYWMAFHLITCSTVVTEHTWMPLAEAVNIGMILCERDAGGFDERWIEDFLDAQDAIVRAWARAGQRGSARLDGPGMQAIARALQIHDLQLEHALRGDLAKAEREMIRRSRDPNLVHAEPARKAA